MALYSVLELNLEILVGVKGSGFGAWGLRFGA